MEAIKELDGDQAMDEQGETKKKRRMVKMSDLQE
jgi:hypothetical protein